MTTAVRNLHPRFEAAIFDFDETMIDLEEQHTAACVRLCDAMGVRYLDMPAEFRLASGKRVIDDVRDLKRFFRWTHSVEDLFARRQEFFDDEITRAELSLMAGVDSFVRELHAKGLRLAVTSSAVRNSIETVLTRFGLRDLFAVIVDGSEVTRGKPDPEAFLVTAEHLSVQPSRCAVFEDSSVGVRAAKAAGMYCVAVRNPRAQVVQDLSAADEIVLSFEELDAGSF